jgi:hypothetical protein
MIPLGSPNSHADIEPSWKIPSVQRLCNTCGRWLNRTS